MKMLNAIDQSSAAVLDESATQGPAVLRETFGILLRALYPVVPHVTHELWQALGYVQDNGDLLDAAWPKVDEGALEVSEIELVLQINGKVRGAITVGKDATRETIEAAALAHEMFARFGNGQPPKKVIVVPGRLVNIVA
jgi:leucyl-tRNA synthetase